MSTDEHNQKYGWPHRRQRARWARQVASGVVNCKRCGEPIDPAEPWDLGHDDVNPGAPSRPEHRACNRSTAGRGAWEKASGGHATTGRGASEKAVSGGARWSRHWFGGFDVRCPQCRDLGVACSDAKTTIEGAA